MLCVEGWAREGAIDKDIAQKIGISVQTLCEWKNRFPEFAEAIKKGKAPVDFQVENALLKAALGYTVTVKKPIKVKSKRMRPGTGTIEEEHIEYADEEVYIKPDVLAQFFWLKNRKPDKWRDKPVAEKPADDPLFELLDRWNKEAAKDADGETE